MPDGEVPNIIPMESSGSNTMMIAGGVFFLIVVVIVIMFAMGGGGSDSSNELSACMNNSTVNEKCKCGESDCDIGKYCSDNNCLASEPEETVDPCEGVDCGLNGTCVNGSCNCNDGYGGDNCENQLEPCTIEADCSNRASAVSGYKGDCDCTCNPHFHGPSCLESDPVNFGDVSPDLVETGAGGELQCVAGTYEDIVNTTCSLCPSDGVSTAPKSIAGRNSSVLDCRCSDINGANNYYYNMTSGSCERCPSDTDNTGAIDEFSRVVPSINDNANPISGTVDDCKCSTNTGWHETTDNNGDRSCVKCQSNSTWDPIQKTCTCDEGYMLQGEGTSAVCQPDTRCLNVCGIYNVQTDTQGEVYDSNGLKTITGLRGGSFQIDHENTSDILTSDGKYGETFKRTNQFQCSVEGGAGKCYFKKDSTSARQACGVATSGWMEDCSRCKEGFKLTFNNLVGFDCVPDICGDGTNVGCFDQTEYNSIIHPDDKTFIGTLPSGSLCHSSDPNEPLSNNVCDVTHLNSDEVARSRNTAGEYRFTANRFTNNGGTTKIRCGISENVRNDGKCVHIEDFCGAEGHENICKNGSVCVNLDIEPKYDCVDPSIVESYNRSPGPNEYNACPTDEDGREYLGYQCHIPNSDICLKGEMTTSGKNRLKKKDDRYGGIETNKVDTKMYSSTYSGPDADTKKITKIMGTTDTDATNYECDCSVANGEGLYGVNYLDDAGAGPTSQTFCRCPEDNSPSEMGEAPFYSIKSNEGSPKLGLEGIKCYIDCAVKNNGSSMEPTQFGDKQYLSGRYFRITESGGRKSPECAPCNDKGMNQVKIFNDDGTTKPEYVNLNFANSKNELCKPAYEGYYGTTEKSTDTSEGEGGEQIGGGNPRTVKEGYLPRSSDDECLAWTPENIYKPFCGDFTKFPASENDTAVLGQIGWPEWGGGYERKTIRYNQSATGWGTRDKRNNDVNRYRDNYRDYFKPACERIGRNMFVGENLGGRTFSGTPQVNPDPEGWRNPGADGSVNFRCDWR